jgi:hypothetical protein
VQTLDPLRALTFAYFTRGGVFLVLHAVCFLYALVELRRFWTWQPRPDEEAWQQLDTRAQKLRGIIQLLLLIGIAGTFSGLFHLSGMKDAKPEEFIKRLDEALSLAFPVGFFGLLWTLLLSIVADVAEGKKEEHLEQLRPRNVSSFEAMVKSLKAIEAHTAALPEAVATALQPVEKLEATLQLALRPTVESLVEVLRQQGDQLVLGKDALVMAANDVRDATRDAKDSIAQLAAATHDAIQALQAARQLEKEAQVLMGSLSGAMARASGLLATTSEELATSGRTVREVEARVASLPERLAGSAEASIATSTNRIFEQLTAATEQQLRASGERLGGHTADMDARIAALAGSLQRAADRVVEESRAERQEWQASFEAERSKLAELSRRLEDRTAEITNFLRSWGDELLRQMKTVDAGHREVSLAAIRAAQDAVQPLVQALAGETRKADAALAAFESAVRRASSELDRRSGPVPAHTGPLSGSAGAAPLPGLDLASLMPSPGTGPVEVPAPAADATDRSRARRIEPAAIADPAPRASLAEERPSRRPGYYASAPPPASTPGPRWWQLWRRWKRWIRRRR